VVKKATMGITVLMNAMQSPIAQNNRCAICEKEENTKLEGKMKISIILNK